MTLIRNVGYSPRWLKKPSCDVTIAIEYLDTSNKFLLKDDMKEMVWLWYTDSKRKMREIQTVNIEKNYYKQTLTERWHF